MLSGAEVATQRAFIMTAIVLIGVMADRAALTLRTLAVAAFAVLILAPQAVVHPSFQMSFAATLALIAAYERSLRWQPNADTTLGARIALWGGNAVAGLILASLVAGSRPRPIAAFHFHRLAPYGVLANLLAMPIVSVWVMPTGLLALIAMPFGFDGFLWRLMGEGIGWMMAVALWVASLPGAVGRMPAFGIGPLLVCTAGLVVLCLLKTPLRWCGAALMALAAVLAIRAPQPDVLVAGDGQALAVRGADGKLADPAPGQRRVHRARMARRRRRRPAAGRSGAARGLRVRRRRLHRQARRRQAVSVVLAPDAFEEDCAPRRAGGDARARRRRDCAATIVDRKLSRSLGALSLIRDGDALGADGGPAGRPGPALGARASRTGRDGAASRRPRGRSRAMRRRGRRIWSRGDQ